MIPQSSIRIWPVGIAPGKFLAFSFVLCTLYGIYVPGARMYEVWLPLLPSVTWISWQSAFLGTAENFAWGWFIAILFIPLYRYFFPHLRKPVAHHFSGKPHRIP